MGRVNDPLRENFQNSVPIVFIVTPPIDVLCSNFVKCGRREIGEIVCCLPDKKKIKIRLAVQQSVLCGSRPKSARASARQYTQSALDFIQIGLFSAELEPNA